MKKPLKNNLFSNREGRIVKFLHRKSQTRKGNEMKVIRKAIFMKGKVREGT